MIFIVLGQLTIGMIQVQTVTAKAKDELLKKLNKFLTCDYKVIESSSWDTPYS